MRLLLVEDSRRLRESLYAGLSRSTFAVDCAADGEEALRYALHNDYDVIVLDLMLPVVDGLTVLSKIRSTGSLVSILILTALDSVPDRVEGLRRGADDYLIKPFAFDELVARIDSLTRRQYRHRNPAISIGSLTVDTSSRSARCSEHDLDLSPREYALLEYLAFRNGEVASRQEIEDHLYGERNLPMSNAVDRVVCTLRKKLEPFGAQRQIETRRGVGFVLVDSDR